MVSQQKILALFFIILDVKSAKYKKWNHKSLNKLEKKAPTEKNGWPTEPVGPFFYYFLYQKVYFFWPAGQGFWPFLDGPFRPGFFLGQHPA